MSVDRVRNILGATPPKATEDERHRARLFVASHSHDMEDCRELLAMLGLIDPGFKWVTNTTHAGMQGRRRIDTQESS